MCAYFLHFSALAKLWTCLQTGSVLEPMVWNKSAQARKFTPAHQMLPSGLGKSESPIWDAVTEEIWTI